ncbi:MAG: glycosyltransferase family 4 protein [Sporocytophaga sp.]|uniref:glycosyltransferase family 4 protein n=1 Tax=Sporocytophaga sp. TaxID=2231183 RepID=UPI001B158B86|nr:glycosyltransferase family 4 protein [Sporocytophaga sp.]MBO9702731.1 glycosyltransferase family 4 protein [Sporocytophaga sp.]
MKVLFVVYEFQDFVSGGLSRVINGVAPELCKLTELDVLHIYPSFIGINLYDVYRCNEASYAASFKRMRLATKNNIIKHIEKENYNIIHFFYVLDLMADVMQELKEKSYSSKLIYSVHNLVKKETSIRRNPDGLLDCEKRMFELSDRIHLLNKSSHSYFKICYPEFSKNDNISIIPNGLEGKSFVNKDDAFIQSLKNKIGPDKKIIFSSSRWAHGKGLEFLIDSMELLLEKREDVVLVLAGRKSKSWETEGDKYVRMIDEKVERIKNSVIVLGWINEAQRNSLFETTDLFVMPSELEYFSYGSLEPLFCEVPLVQSKIDCLEEFLVDGEDCLFFNPKDSHDLSVKIEIMLDDSERSLLTARNGSLKVKANFIWSEIAIKYMEMYQSALNPVQDL